MCICVNCHVARLLTTNKTGLCVACSMPELKTSGDNMSDKYCVRYHLGRVAIDPDAEACPSCLRTEEYYRQSTMTVMVPIKIIYSKATDAVVEWQSPTRDDIEKAFYQQKDKP